MGFQALLG